MHMLSSTGVISCVSRGECSVLHGGVGGGGGFYCMHHCVHGS